MLNEAKQSIGDGAKWAAVLNHDRSADGAFYYSVETTGVYCRPSCLARRPNRANVRFHDTPEAAERAGFRPCKRCKPDRLSLHQEQVAKVAEACRLIEQAPAEPKLGELAKAIGLSPYYFHRIFKSVTGVTPKAYASAHRHKRVRAHLKESRNVTEAIYDAGFNSDSRFYATSSQVLGMTPADYRSGGTNIEIRFAIGECSLGAILVAASEKGICAIVFGDEREALLHNLKKQFPRARLVPGDEAFTEMLAKVIQFVETPGVCLDLPLDIRGTAFQHRVWNALRQIPPGSTASYTEIAERIGAPKSVRAVAGACAANPIAVAVPCHRVVKSDGSLSGYRSGVKRKRALLDREAQSRTRLENPSTARGRRRPG